MAKSLEITRDIVVAALNSTNNIFPTKDTGESVVEFIQTVYDKVRELEHQER